MGIKARIPNQLTLLRVLLSVAFFAMVGMYDDGPGDRALLNVAFAVFVVAGITDVLDGYLARKWEVTSVFGRIVDPFVDKLMIVGGFVMLGGANFALENMLAPDWKIPEWLTGDMASGVQSWMIVVILAREFIVSAIRGYSESQGKPFPAIRVGKLKMLLQSVSISFILFQLANWPDELWAAWVKVALVWATVAVTVFSGVVYVYKARRLILTNA